MFKDELARVHSHCRQFGSSMLADAKEILGDFAGALFSIRYSKYQGLWSWPKVTRGGMYVANNTFNSVQVLILTS